MQEGMELIFIRFGIEMHMGCEKTVCKTKHVFSPPPQNSIRICKIEMA